MAEDEDAIVTPDERVTLVKFEKGRVSVKYETRNGSVWEKHSFPACTDKPEPEFVSAFLRLNAPALKIGHVAEKRWQIETVVTEIKIDHEKSGRLGFELTLSHETESGAASMYLPSRLEKLSESERGAQYATAEMVRDIKLIIAAALLYVRGERVQAEMEMGEEKEREEDAEEKPEPRRAAAKTGRRGQRAKKKR